MEADINVNEDQNRLIVVSARIAIHRQFIAQSCSLFGDT